jgi:hypothetical protein
VWFVTREMWVRVHSEIEIRVFVQECFMIEHNLEWGGLDEITGLHLCEDF